MVLECVLEFLVIVTHCWRDEMSHFSFKIGTLTEHLLLVNKFDESFRVRLVKFIVTGHLFEVYFGVFFLSSSVQFGVFFKLCTVVCSIVRSS